MASNGTRHHHIGVLQSVRKGTFHLTRDFTNKLAGKFFRDNSAFAIRRLAMRKREAKRKLIEKAIEEKRRHRSAIRKIGILRQRAAMRERRWARREHKRSIYEKTQRRAARTIQSYAKVWLSMRNFYERNAKLRRDVEHVAAIRIQQWYRLGAMRRSFRRYERAVAKSRRIVEEALRRWIGRVRRRRLCERIANRIRRRRASSTIAKGWRRFLAAARRREETERREKELRKAAEALKERARKDTRRRLDQVVAKKKHQQRVDRLLAKRRMLGDRRRDRLVRAAQRRIFANVKSAKAFPLLSEDPISAAATALVPETTETAAVDESSSPKDESEKWTARLYKLGLADPNSEIHRTEWRRSKRAQARRERWKRV